MVSLQVFGQLMLFSIVRRSLELRSGLAGRLMCGLSKLSKVLHRVVFPEPGSPASNTGWFASNMRFRRKVHFLYYVNTLRLLLVHILKCTRTLNLCILFRTNLRSDGICQQCFSGAYLTADAKKVLKHSLFIWNNKFVPAIKQNLAGYDVKLWPVAEIKA